MNDFLVFGIILILTYSIGKIGDKIYCCGRKLEKNIFLFAFGFFLISQITFFCGIINKLNVNFLITILVILYFLSTLVKGCVICKLFQHKNIHLPLSFPRKLKTFLIIIILINILFHFIGVISPPIGNDAMIYHLSLPKIYVQNHSIIDRPDILNSTFPKFAEMLYSLSLLLDSEITPKLINLFFYIMTILTVYMVSNIFVRPFWALLSVNIFMNIPAFNRLIGYTKNDIILIFYITFSIYFFIKFLYNEKYAQNEVNIRNLYFSIFFGAISLSIKYFGIIYFVSLISTIIIFVLNKLNKKNIIKLLFVIIISLFLNSNYYIYNYIKIGNPFFPFFNKYFKKVEKKIDKNEKKYKIFTNKNIVKHFKVNKYRPISFKNYLRLPYDLSIKFQYYDTWKYAIGPFFFLFYVYLLILIFKDKKNRYIYLSVFCLMQLYITIIYFNGPRSRYILPIYSVLAISSGVFFKNYTENKKKIFDNLILYIFLLSFVLNLGLVFSQHIRKLAYLFGKETKYTYLSEKFYMYGEYYQMLDYLNNKLSERDKILVLHQNVYYLDINYIVGLSEHLHRYIVDYNKLKTSKSLYERLKQLKINYILLNDYYGKRFSKISYQRIMKLYKDKYCEITHKTNGNILFKLIF